MATFDEGFSAAVKQLDEQGLLWNVQLSRLVDGDETLSRDIRDSLIADGFAEDRYGVGLARLNNPDARCSRRQIHPEAIPCEQESSPEVTFAAAETESSVDDWWLMTSGIIHGPLAFATIRLMRRCGEIVGLDLVRQGERGAWQCPETVVGLTDVSDVDETEYAPSTDMIDQAPHRVDRVRPQPLADRKTGLKAPAHDSVSVPPEKAEREVQDDGKERDATRTSSQPQPKLGARSSMNTRSPATAPLGGGNVRTATLTREVTLRNRSTSNAKSPGAGRSTFGELWHQAAGLVGGRSRLWGLLVSAAAVVLAVAWWRQPPSAGRVYREIAECHQKLAELRTKQARVADVSKMLADEQSRIRALRDSLKGRASAARPAEQELLWACEYGLLPLLKHPANAPEFERVFANHMERAQRLIDPAKAAAENASLPPPVDDTQSNARHAAQ